MLCFQRERRAFSRNSNVFAASSNTPLLIAWSRTVRSEKLLSSAKRPPLTFRRSAARWFRAYVSDLTSADLAKTRGESSSRYNLDSIEDWHRLPCPQRQPLLGREVSCPVLHVIGLPD
jgi:hypothetical protein